MTKKCLAALFICILTLAISVSGQSGVQSKTRNLTLYEKAGPYYVKPLNTEVDIIKGDIREFLWGHWRNRQLGYLVAIFYPKEGGSSTTSYFIEPDEEGNWYIAVKIERVRNDRRPASNLNSTRKPIHETVEYAAYFIERIEIPRDGLTRRVIIPKEKTLSSQSYRLRLKDKSKKVRVEF